MQSTGPCERLNQVRGRVRPGPGGDRHMVPSRDRTYLFSLALSLVAICAFGVFIVQDYKENSGAGNSASTAVRVVPLTNGQPEAAIAAPGAAHTPVSGPGSSTTTTTT